MSFEVGPIGNKKIAGKKGTKVWLTKGAYAGIDGVKVMMDFSSSLTQCIGVINEEGFTTVGLAENPLIPKCIKIDKSKHVKVTKGDY